MVKRYKKLMTSMNHWQAIWQQWWAVPVLLVAHFVLLIIGSTHHLQSKWVWDQHGNRSIYQNRELKTWKTCTFNWTKWLMKHWFITGLTKSLYLIWVGIHKHEWPRASFALISAQMHDISHYVTTIPPLWFIVYVDDWWYCWLIDLS